VKNNTRFKRITIVDVGNLGVPLVLIETKNGHGFIGYGEFTFITTIHYMFYNTMYSFNLLIVLVFHFL